MEIFKSPELAYAVLDDDDGTPCECLMCDEPDCRLCDKSNQEALCAASSTDRKSPKQSF